MRSIALILLAVALPGLPAQGMGQDRTMSVVDLLDVPQLSDPEVSRDGRQLLYIESRADWEANRRTGSIWRVNADGSGATRLTTGGQSPRWSPDGRFIAFVADRGHMPPTLPGVRIALDRPGTQGASQIFLLPNDGGEARPLTRHPTGVSSISWSPDGEFLYFLAFDPHTAEEIARHEARDDVYGFDEAFKQRHLWRVSAANGTTQRITSGDFSVVDYDLARDGRRIVIHRSPDPNILQYQWDERPEVWVMNADGGGQRQLTDNQIPESSGRLSPDGSHVLVLAQANLDWEYYYNRNIFLLPVEGGEPTLLTGDFPHEVLAAEWSRDGRSILFHANTGVESQLFEVDVSGGRPRQLTRGLHSMAQWKYQPDSHLQVLTLANATNPGDLWLVPAGTGEMRRVTTVFDYLKRDFRLPAQERVEWTGADGVTVDGLLTYPVDYVEGRRYPLVVKTHGGPQTSDRYGFRTEPFSSHGYAMLEPNYRGSTGYGDPFLRDMVPGYFNQSHLDVMTGVDHVIAMGVADPDRLIKMGWSGGGHMTNKLITFTDRFRVAASGAGAANWVSMYAQSDMRVQRTPWFGGTPWQKDAPLDLYWDHSPLKYVAAVTTPTIFMFGENDVRVPPSQGVEMYRALKSHGVPTHLYIAPREGHGWQELRHQLFRRNAELEWFKQHLGEPAHFWESPPEGGER